MISDDFLKKLCEEAGIAKGIYENERFLFTLKQVANFYYDGNITIDDVCDGFVDGAQDGGIDFMTIKDDQLLLIQGKTGHLDKDAINSIFEKIVMTIKKIENKDYSSLKNEVISGFLNMKANLTDKGNIKIVLFSKEEISDSLEKYFESYDKYKSEYEVEIIDQKEIEIRIADLDPNRKVETGTLIIDNSNNVLNYGHGSIVNVSAASLKQLVAQCSTKGLFSYNLRGKISGKVDDKIELTIKEEPTEFWYRNNGITIGCEKYKINENNTITLEQFSIINGAQTTTNIKESIYINDENDFYVVCKIIKTPEDMKMEKAQDYLHTISVASNSQKPITPQDIKSNDPCQVLLRQRALTSSLPFEVAIKRPIKYEVKKFASWQQIENALLAQLILSCVCQLPGPAKASKSKSMDDEKLYDCLFKREYRIENYYDLTMLYKKFNEFKNSQKKKLNNMPESEKTPELIRQFAICKEGVFSILAIIYHLLSKTKIKEKIDTYPNPIDASKHVREINFKNRIFEANNYDEISTDLFELFELIIETISGIYKNKQSITQSTSEAYFLKNSENYYKYIIPEFDQRYEQKANGKLYKTLINNVFNTK